MLVFDNKIRIVLTGGGTGGHIFPLIAVAEQLRELSRRLDQELELYYLGPMQGPFVLDPSTFGEINIQSIAIASESPNNIDSPLFKVKSFFKIIWGTIQCLWHVWRIMPDVVFSKGGYGALPALLAGFLYRIPLVIHESDSSPGKINEFSKKMAARVAIAFEKSAAYFPVDKTALVGNPIRQSFFQADSQDKAYEYFHLNQSLPVIFIIGGSQGAKTLNDLILNVLPFLLEKYQVIHQCGSRHHEETVNESAIILANLDKDLKQRYCLYGLLGEEAMRYAYGISRLVVSRSGSGSIFEIAAKAKPAILVPLSTAARDHQRDNAYDYAQTGAAVVLEENNLKSRMLLETINLLMDNPAKLKQMSGAAKTFARPEAALTIARELMRLAGISV
jgi:UDP-N-acetylglucosamine--N-acetylmuramyl-(pentapeptide) pyrophosphoryl-undecaprenol N-acetylglucosamine transferase